jgi:hypothetical protein
MYTSLYFSSQDVNGCEHWFGEWARNVLNVKTSSGPRFIWIGNCKLIKNCKLLLFLGICGYCQLESEPSRTATVFPSERNLGRNERLSSQNRTVQSVLIAGADLFKYVSVYL